MKLQQYDFTVVHRPGRAHRIADVVSRIKHKTIATFQSDTSTWCTSSDAYDKNLDFRRITAAVTTATMDKVCDQQLTDPDLRPIIMYLETGQLPDDLSTVRQIVVSSDQYLMKNNLLYHLSEHNLARHRPNIYCQLVVPASIRNEILQSCHDDPLSGHLGFKKTYNKLRERFHWKHMYSDCDFWCKSCIDCATKKTPKQLSKAPLLPIPANYPFEKVAVDVFGPFPTSENNNKYIINFTDTFTHWPEAFAVQSADKDTTAILLVEQIICRFGAPKELLSDRGKNFLSDLVVSVAKILQMH